MTRVVIVPRNDAEAALWRTAEEVAGLFRDWPWVIVGAQMVMLLEFERGRPSGRATRDLDAIVDVRVVGDVTRLAAERLQKAGFEPSAVHPHRFVRGQDVVDLLAPDHLGPRADLTTIPPHTTTEIPGGSRALATRRVVDVEIVGVGFCELPVPSLAGAIALKATAYGARRAERDLEDLVRLLSLVGDVEAVRRELKPSERIRLGSISPLKDETHAAWSISVDPDDARAAFARLADQ